MSYDVSRPVDMRPHVLIYPKVNYLLVVEYNGSHCYSDLNSGFSLSRRWIKNEISFRSLGDHFILGAGFVM